MIHASALDKRWEAQAAQDWPKREPRFDIGESYSVPPAVDNAAARDIGHYLCDHPSADLRQWIVGLVTAVADGADTG